MSSHDGSHATAVAHAAQSSVSAISWPAIFGGAVAAAAATSVLLFLGVGLGLASVSPWAGAGASAFSFTVGAGIWLIVTQWLSAGLGGYITGRLRTRWVGTHTHEVFFRDTAHGFLTWALASLAGVAILGGLVASVAGTGARVAGASVQMAATNSTMVATQQYGVESLFRGAKPDAAFPTADTLSEATHILVSGLVNGGLPQADRAYLANLVATRTGISQPEAQKRVDDVVALENATELKLRQAADAARKAGSRAGFFTALSMLIGALIASAAAALGGQLRDEHI